MLVRTARWILVAATAAGLTACPGDENEGDGSTADSRVADGPAPPTMDDSSQDTPDPADDSDTDAPSPSEGAFVAATGTVNGYEIALACDDATFDQVGYASLLQCQDGSGLHMIQCRATDANAHGFDGLAFINIQLYRDSHFTVGAHTFPDDTIGGLSISGTMDFVSLNGLSANLDVSRVDVTAATAGERIEGSFEAAWTEAGDGVDFADVSGTFAIVCPADR